jgi:transposase
VFEPTGSRRDAASVIFNLPGYRVIAAVDLPLGGRRIKVQPVDLDHGCPDCGVVSARVHSWTVQRVRDISHAGQVEVVVRKPRLVCAEAACRRRTFTATSEQLPARARCTSRLKTALLTAIIDSGRAVAEVAANHGVSWWTVQATINAAAVLLPDVDNLQVRRLGIDEHRYRAVRWFRDEAGGWRRVEPWMTTIVNADSGQILGIVDGRHSAAVGGWLGQRSPAWRERIEIVAIDPSAAFKKAITQQLPNAKISVDPFHLVQLAKSHADPRAATASPGTQAAPRPQDRPRLGAPHPAAARLRHLVRAGPGPPRGGVRHRRPNRGTLRRLGRQGTAPPSPQR